MQKKVSILLITYNPSWDKYRQTLYSIITQKNIEFSLVISDDGSDNDYFDLAEKYLKNNNFTSYRFLKNIKNQGIVKNILLGLSVIDEKYVKLISPGDFLYDNNTLKNFVDFAEKNPATLYFGNMFCYSLDSKGNIIYFDNKKNPYDLRPWKKNDYKIIKKNYIVKCDRICGATIMYNTEKFKSYLEKICGFVSFAEDCAVTYMIAKNEPIFFMNVNGGIWYEYGAGISTQKNNLWNDRIKSDFKNLYTHLLEEQIIPKWNYRMYFAENKIERLILLFLKNPNTYFEHLFKKKIKGYKDIKYNKDELKKILEI